MVMDWDGKQVLLLGKPWKDDPFDVDVAEVVKADTMNAVSMALKKLYIHPATRYDVCPECGGEFGRVSEADDTEAGFCMSCRASLYLVHDKVHTWLTGNTGWVYVWTYWRDGNGKD